jgi:hypothetical protein
LWTSKGSPTLHIYRVRRSKSASWWEIKKLKEKKIEKEKERRRRKNKKTKQKTGGKGKSSLCNQIGPPEMAKAISQTNQRSLLSLLSVLLFSSSGRPAHSFDTDPWV